MFGKVVPEILSHEQREMIKALNMTGTEFYLIWDDSIQVTVCGGWPLELSGRELRAKRLNQL